MPLRTVLLTGFEPFDGQVVNPSAQAVRELAGHTIAGRTIAAEVLPVVFDEASARLRQVIDEIDPELVIAVGQAGGRAEISVERIAINVDDARIPDNVGNQPIDRPIAPDGPPAYWSSLPIKAIVAAVREQGIPASVSQSAGTFVCNNVFYQLMAELSDRPGVRGGFVHVPCLPEQVGPHEPSLPLHAIVHALRIAVATSLAVVVDEKITGGALS